MNVSFQTALHNEHAVGLLLFESWTWNDVYQINDPRLDLIADGIGTAIAGLAAWLAYLMVEAASRSTATGVLLR
jgi:hypothetical protein